MPKPAPNSAPQSGNDIQQTLQALDSAVGDTSLASASGLGIPELRALKQEIAEIFPASNLPAFLLQGLVNLKDRNLASDRVIADLRVLLRETGRLGLYGTFLAAPATIIHGYQQLLTLAGKDVSSAFPDGTWQFYTEFGLREDAARHSVETIGFQQAAPALSDADAATCWVYAALHTLFVYDELLENEWHERMFVRCIDLALLEQAQQGPLPRKPDERIPIIRERVRTLREHYALERLGHTWTTRRPFAGPSANPLDGFAAARRSAFDTFIRTNMLKVPPELRTRAEAIYQERRTRDLPIFQAQMTLLQSLYPDSFREQRQPLAPEHAGVGLICGGSYAMVDLWERDSDGTLLMTPRDGDATRPGQRLPLDRDGTGALIDRYGQPVVIDRQGMVRIAGRRLGRLRRAPLAQIRAQVYAALHATPPLPPHASLPTDATDLRLAQVPRARQEEFRSLLGAQTRGELAALRNLPIIVNWDQHSADAPLGLLRRTRRGCGDHAMTIIRTDRSTVFDMSHIFFDGAWGSALAEMMTGFAGAVARQLGSTKRRTAALTPAEPLQRLSLTSSAAFLKATQGLVRAAHAEVNAETTAVSLSQISTLRRRMAEREMYLTVNDLLLLGRYAHAATYTPGPATLAALDDLASRGASAKRLANQIHQTIEMQRSVVPALLIPMDASAVDPRERLYPATLRNPYPELLPLLDRCDALARQLAKRTDADTRANFHATRVRFVGELLKFGDALRMLREVTTRGESFTTSALKLMAHLPQPMQSLLDLIPQKIDVLNELVKGVEVFSNIGQVARGSSLTRFASSRDDGDTKVLIWGVMTAADGQLVITLRDFRPHIAPLLADGYQAVAELLAADFLHAYAETTNRMVRNIQRVLTVK
jgi:hypothetical protein